MGNLSAQEAANFSGTTLITDYPETPVDLKSGTRVFHTVMAGKSLKEAGVQQTQTNEYLVVFELDSEGAAVFREYITLANVGKVLAIVLDKKVISAPPVKSAIYLWKRFARRFRLKLPVIFRDPAALRRFAGRLESDRKPDRRPLTSDGTRSTRAWSPG